MLTPAIGARTIRVGTSTPPIVHGCRRFAGIGDGIGGVLTRVDRGGTIRPPPTAGSPPAVSCSGSRRRVVKEVILTPQGFKKLQAEIEELSTVRRRDVAERIRIAREFRRHHGERGVRLREERTRPISRRASRRSRSGSKNARVVTKKEIRSGEVSVGTKVRLRDMGSTRRSKYHVVGSAEADPAELKLSNESPVGKAIMGPQEGRRGRGSDAARGQEVQDHGRQSRLAAFVPPRLGGHGRAETVSAPSMGLARVMRFAEVLSAIEGVHPGRRSFKRIRPVAP